MSETLNNSSIAKENLFIKEIGDLNVRTDNHDSLYKHNENSSNDEDEFGDYADLDEEKRRELNRKPSNLNRDAKLKLQESILSKKRLKEKSILTNQLISQGANLPRNHSRYNNANQPRINEIRSYSTQPEPDEDNSEKKSKLTNKQNASSGYSIPKTFSDNLPSSVKLMSVTCDHSKDYTSSSDQDEEENLENGTSHLDTSYTSPVSNSNSNSKVTMKKIFHHNELNQSMSIDDQSSVLMIAPLKTETEDNSNNNSEQELDEQIVDLSMFDLLDKTSKKFILKPGTIGLSLKCQIYRQKGLYPQYKFYIENLDGNLLLVMTARKKKVKDNMLPNKLHFFRSKRPRKVYRNSYCKAKVEPSRHTF